MPWTYVDSLFWRMCHPLVSPVVQPSMHALHFTFRLLNQLLAAFTLMVIVGITMLLWPIESLGFRIDLSTHMVEGVVRGSAADMSGLKAGDKILELYNHPFDDVITSASAIQWLRALNHAIPVVVDRNGQLVRMDILRRPASMADSLYVGAVTGLALCCWLTGYVLGVLRPHDVIGSRLVPVFWLLLSAFFGAVTFAQALAIPVFVILLWLLMTVLAPCLMYTHVHYPPRVRDPHIRRLTRWCLVGVIMLLNSGLVVMLVSADGSLIRLHDILLHMLPFTVLVAVGASGIVLSRAYRRMTVAHRRRQIRLIVAACLFITLVWALLRVVPLLISRPAGSGTLWLILTGWTLPLAYLVGGISSDLYRIDRLITWLLLHLTSLTVLALLLSIAVTALNLEWPGVALWASVVVVACYRPLHHSLQRVFNPRNADQQRYYGLEGTLTNLSRTLDAPALTATLLEGIGQAFGQPANAVFLASAVQEDTLTCQTSTRLQTLPMTITPGKLTAYLRQGPSIIDSQAMHKQLGQHRLTPVEQQLLDNPAVALWCPIRHAHGPLLGLLLLGMRSDLDPYRRADLQALQRVLAAATLAFNNSHALRQQRAAEDLIRQLYQRLQRSQDAAARELARELHDEILNVYVRLNIGAVERLQNDLAGTRLADEVRMLLESERGLSDALRMLSEQLYPTGIDDPLGFPAVLRMQVEKTQAQWTGELQLQFTGTPQPIAPAIQREALRIVKEGLTNVLKHAAATVCTVCLEYPSSSDTLARLHIIDNGQTHQVVTARTGHLGVRGMQESARAVGGQLALLKTVEGGTHVVFSFPTVGGTVPRAWDEGADEQAA